MHPRSCKKAKASNICFEIQRICGSDRPWSNSRGEGEGERGRRGEGKKGKGREGERKGERRRGGGGKEIGESRAGEHQRGEYKCRGTSKPLQATARCLLEYVQVCCLSAVFSQSQGYSL